MPYQRNFIMKAIISVCLFVTKIHLAKHLLSNQAAIQNIDQHDWVLMICITPNFCKQQQQNANRILKSGETRGIIFIKPSTIPGVRLVGPQCGKASSTNYWPNLQIKKVVSPCGLCNQCKWRPLMTQFTINTSGATWWLNLQPMKVASPSCPIWNQCQWHLAVFATNETNWVNVYNVYNVYALYFFRTRSQVGAECLKMSEILILATELWELAAWMIVDKWRDGKEC